VGSSRIYNSLTKTTPFEGFAGPIVEYPLRHDAATAWASSILPQPFLELVDFSAGSWVAPLPQETPEEAANRFTSGVLAEPPVSAWSPLDLEHVGPQMSQRIAADLGCSPADLVVVPKASLVLFAARWVLDHLASRRSAVALVREMKPRGEPDHRAWSTPMGTFYPVADNGLAPEPIADLLDSAADSSGSFALLTSSGRLDPHRSVSVTATDLTELISVADGLILGAYDGEGYVRWSHGTV